MSPIPTPSPSGAPGLPGVHWAAHHPLAAVITLIVIVVIIACFMWVFEHGIAPPARPSAAPHNVEGEVEWLRSDVTSLESKVEQLTRELSSLQATVADLQYTVDGLEP